MKFIKFGSIEQHYRKKYIEILKEHGFDNIPYIATEKIHGSNFSFWTNGKDVRIAQRSQFTDGNFYKCQEVFDRYKDNVVNLKNKLFPGADQIAVYGELYGPGIQSGIYYSNQKDFRAFDLRVDTKFEPALETREYLTQYNIPLVPFIGIYKNVYEALEESNIFESKVQFLDAEKNGTEVQKFKDGENCAEGLVIQPLEKVLYTNNGKRVIIKSKHPKFSEKKNRKNRTPFEPNPFVPVVEQYVNQNRLDSVMSKFGEATIKDFGSILKLMSNDVIEDMVSDEEIPNDWRKQDNYKNVGKAVSTVVATFLKNTYCWNCENEYYSKR